MMAPAKLLASFAAQSYTIARMKKHTSLVLTVLFFVGLSHLALSAADKITPAELVAKHLGAIGTEEARKKNETRSLDGLTAVKFIVGGHGILQGTGKLLSRKNDMRYTSQLGAVDYPGEDFIKQGDKTSVAVISPGVRSPLGSFFFLHSEILREGLLGGVMSAAWPLENLEAHDAKLTVRGVKNIGGKKLYEVSYQPRKADSDLDIRLYFDVETFQHVMTRYHFKLHSFQDLRSGSGSPDSNNNVEERFSDFREVDGITIPLRWIIHYEVEGGAIIDYEMVAQKAGHDAPEDAFKIP